MSTATTATGGSVVVNSDGTFTFTPTPNYNGPASFSFKANDASADSNEATFSITVSAVEGYTFTGFFQPVENPDSTKPVNSAKAGQTVPLKWNITPSGADESHIVSLTSSNVSCSTFNGSPTDTVETYSSGGSGLQYLGDGNWQFNWQTLKGWANTCRAVTLELDDGSKHKANFQFKSK